MKRRDFVQTLAGGTALAMLPSGFTGCASVEKRASDRIALGQVKLSVSRLGLGTGTEGMDGASDQTRQLGFRGLVDLLREGFDKGVTVWDTADSYGTHAHIREALKGLPREKVTVITKTNATTESQMRDDLDRFRRELDTDYIDIVLLHYIQNGNWTEERKGAMEALAEATEKGTVKMRGLSSHSFDAMKVAASDPWSQVQLARINLAGDRHMEGPPEKVLGVLREAKAHGKAVIGMKVLGEGDLISRIDDCYRFILSNSDAVDAFVVGMVSRTQLDDNIRRIAAAGKQA
ncbi:MAG: aldo/keto reductase [bacterium]|jgi:predicted aldo/keto reductase-like oxidoreductase